METKILTQYKNRQSWYGHSLDKEKWMYYLKEKYLIELDSAMRKIEEQKIPLLDISKENFIIHSLNEKLQSIKEEVLHGVGFGLIRGLDIKKYSKYQAAIIYMGIGVNIGELVTQNSKGHILGHVANLGLNFSDPEVRGYQTSARLPYHSDASDIVTLLCLQTPQSGGLSSVVSSTTLWNELVKRRPDYAEILSQSFCYTRWGEVPKGRLPYRESPVFSHYNSRVISTYIRSAINKAQTMEGVPKLTQEQINALDYLDALTSEKGIYLDMEFKEGDIQIVSNYSILHSRTSYIDWPEQEKRRHLLRLWIGCEEGPELPQHIYERMGTCKNGRPDGIRLENSQPKASIEID